MLNEYDEEELSIQRSKLQADWVVACCALAVVLLVTVSKLVEWLR